MSALTFSVCWKAGYLFASPGGLSLTIEAGGLMECGEPLAWRIYSMYRTVDTACRYSCSSVLGAPMDMDAHAKTLLERSVWED